jgi:hypothetical protein
MDKDNIAARMETFDAASGGGVGWYQDKGAFCLYLLATEAPIARLKPTGINDEVRINNWSYRRKWEHTVSGGWRPRFSVCADCGTPFA